MVGSFGPQSVGRSEVTVEVTEVERADRGQLEDDHIWLRALHGFHDLVGIERVRDHRHRTQLVEHCLFRRAVGQAMHLVTGRNQSRYQLPADRSRRACNEDVHQITSSIAEHMHAENESGALL